MKFGMDIMPLDVASTS